MPKIGWEKLSDIKHSLAQERTIICGIKLSLQKLDIPSTIALIEKCDKRLGNLEDELIQIIESVNNEDGDLLTRHNE